MANGSRHALYAVLENTYGDTPQNPTFETVRITGTTLGLAKDSLQSEEIRSDRQIADFRLGNNQVGGDINFELSYGSFDKFLQAALMALAWEQDTPVAGTEQIKTGISRSSFTIVRHFGDLPEDAKPYYIYRGVEINQLKLNIAPSAMVTGSFSVVGKSQQIATDLSSMGTPTILPPTTTTPLDSFSGSLKEGGTEIAVITEISLTLENGVEPRFVVGSKDSIKPSVSRSNLTGQITAYFEDSRLVDKFINETESSIVFTLPDAAGNLMAFEIPRIKYTGGQPDVDGEGPITLTMPFQALVHPTAKSNILIQRNPA